MARPDPIPNSAVKHSIANGSGSIGSARVGRRQIFQQNAVSPPDTAFCFIDSAFEIFIATFSPTLQFYSMQAVQEKPANSSWFFDALGEIGDFVGRLLRNFSKVIAAGALFTIVVLFSVYIGTAGGPGWRTPTLLSSAFLMCALVTIPLSANLAVVLSLAQTIRAKHLAQRVFDALFADLLGVSNENPQGNHEQIKELHGMPIPELRAKLQEAGRHILAHPITASFPAFIRWLIRKAERVLVWATVRVIVAYATRKADPNRTVDLLALRENLAAVVDDLVTRRITGSAIRFAFIAALLTTALVWCLVRGVVRIS